MPNTPFAATSAINSITDLMLGIDEPYELSEKPFRKKGQIKDQSIPYLMELENCGKIDVFVFPRGVESAKYIYTPRTSVVYTQAGAFNDIIGILPPKIQITGTFGYYGAAKISAHDGQSLQKHLEQAIKVFYMQFGKYSHRGEPIKGIKWPYIKNDGTTMESFKDVELTQPPKITFYDFVADEEFAVNIDQVAFHRSIQRKYLYMYEISMTALQKPAWKKRTEQLETRNGWGKLFGKITNFPSMFGTIGAFLGKIKGFLMAANRFVGAIKSKIDVAINIVKQITAAITAAAAKDITDLPNQIAKEFQSAMINLMNAIVPNNDIPNEFVIAARENVRLSFALVRDTAKNPVQATPQNDRRAEDRLFTNPQNPRMTTVARTPISSNDTIRSIAARNNVDWQQVVAANNLVAPFITTNFMDRFPPALSRGRLGADAPAGSIILTIYDAVIQIGNILVIEAEAMKVISVSGNSVTIAAPTTTAHTAGSIVTIHERQLNVLMPGDQINIPGDGSGGAVGIGDDFEETLYWIDEALDELGLMASDGDVAIMRGLSNLEMQLRHLIMTKRGELSELGHPDFGSLVPEFIGMVNTPVWNLRTKLECELTVRQDPRVADISNSRLLVDGTAIYFEADVYPINQTAPMQISLPLS